MDPRTSPRGCSRANTTHHQKPGLHPAEHFLQEDHILSWGWASCPIWRFFTFEKVDTCKRHQTETLEPLWEIIDNAIEDISSYIQRTWTFVTQIKHAGDTGLSVDTFLAKPSLTCVWKVGLRRPCLSMYRVGWAAFLHRISENASLHHHWKQTQDALCSVNTREVKCELSGPLMC